MVSTHKRETIVCVRVRVYAGSLAANVSHLYHGKCVEVHVHPVAKPRPEFHFCVCACVNNKIYKILRKNNCANFCA